MMIKRVKSILRGILMLGLLVGFSKHVVVPVSKGLYHGTKVTVVKVVKVVI